MRIFCRTILFALVLFSPLTRPSSLCHWLFLEKLIFLRKEIKFFSAKPRGNRPKRETYKGTPLVDFDYLFGN
jgi:hypothetical protein